MHKFAYSLATLLAIAVITNESRSIQAANESNATTARYSGYLAAGYEPFASENADINALLTDADTLIRQKKTRYAYTLADDFVLSGDHQNVQDLLQEADRVFHDNPEQASILMKEAISILDVYSD